MIHPGAGTACLWALAMRGSSLAAEGCTPKLEQMQHTLQELAWRSSLHARGKCIPPLELVRHTLQELEKFPTTEAGAA